MGDLPIEDTYGCKINLKVVFFLNIFKTNKNLNRIEWKFKELGFRSSLWFSTSIADNVWKKEASSIQ